MPVTLCPSTVFWQFAWRKIAFRNEFQEFQVLFCPTKGAASLSKSEGQCSESLAQLFRGDFREGRES
jgi:hypothetical protein